MPHKHSGRFFLEEHIGEKPGSISKWRGGISEAHGQRQATSKETGGRKALYKHNSNDERRALRRAELQRQIERPRES